MTSFARKTNCGIPYILNGNVKYRFTPLWSYMEYACCEWQRTTITSLLIQRRVYVLWSFCFLQHIMHFHIMVPEWVH